MIRFRRRMVIALGLGFGVWLTGCGGGAVDKLPRQAVYGNVTLDGQSLAKGMISFTPVAGQADPVSAGAVISDGSYSIVQAEGLTPGKYKVSISSGGDDAPVAKDAAPGPAPKKKRPPSTERVPGKYNAQSTLDAVIKANESNKINYELTSK